MKKGLPARVVLLCAVLVMAGCAHSEDLRPALNKNTQDVNNLLLAQDKLIKAKAAPSDVYGEALKTDPFRKAIHELCYDANMKPRAPLKSCIFYTELSGRFTAQMLLNAGKYYARNDNREKAGQILTDLTVRFADNAYKSEADQAKYLLENFNGWDRLSPGEKAFLVGDYETALREFKASDAPESQHKVGEMYDRGEGVPLDRTQAAEWYRKAAVKGFAPAQYRLGMLYLNGDGVERDDRQARSWFQKAADQDFVPAKDALKNL